MSRILGGWFGKKCNSVAPSTNGRSIGFFVGICFIVNAITGSGIPFISSIFQKTGIFVTITLFILYSYISAQSSLFVVYSMKAVPGNDEFDEEIEFTTLVDFFFGRNAYLISFAFFLVALMSNTVESIVITSQIIDSLYVTIFGSTCGLKASPQFEISCVGATDSKYPSPFENDFMIFTLGFLTVLLLVVPFGLYSLEQNMTAQVAFFLGAIAIVAIWFYQSISSGLDFSKVPIFGSSYLYAPGTIMLNLAMATIIPSWVNLKRPSVDVKTSILASVGVSVALYFLGGYFPATILDIGDSGNFNSAMMNTSLLGKISIFLFPLATLVPSIPINMMVNAINLKRDKIIKNKATIFFLSFVLPWITCIPLQTGNGMIKFISWTSIIFSAVVNFIIGPILYLKSRSFEKKFSETRALTENQKYILLNSNSNIPSSLKNIIFIEKEDNTTNGKACGIDKEEDASKAVSNAPTLDIDPIRLLIDPISHDKNAPGHPVHREEQDTPFGRKSITSYKRAICRPKKVDSDKDAFNTPVPRDVSPGNCPDGRLPRIPDPPAQLARVNSDDNGKLASEGALATLGCPACENYNENAIKYLDPDKKVKFSFYENFLSGTSIAYANIFVVVATIILNIGVEIREHIK